MTHTPGPWRLILPQEEYHKPVVQRGTEGGFAVLGRSRDQELADARLIAAAPDLLAALEMVLEDAPTRIVMDAGHEIIIRATLKKARGE